MAKTITINDIAEQLNLSRNTVSKALNGKYVPEKTRLLVLNKARELNYKQMNQETYEIAAHKKYRILLLSGKPLNNISFFSPIIQGIENFCYKNGHQYFQHVFNNAISNFKTLANQIKELNVDGIIAIETFDKSFIFSLIELNIPICFIDFSASSIYADGNFDIVEANNSEPIHHITRKLIKKYRIERFCFVGDFTHCMSFKERYLGMLSALSLNNISHAMNMDILRNDNFDYGNPEIIKLEIQKLKNRPECYICGNDFIARTVIKSLKLLNITVPNKAFVVGFDDAKDSINAIPSITTVGINNVAMGIEAIETLLKRIENPTSPPKIIKIHSNIIFRESTSKPE